MKNIAIATLLFTALAIPAMAQTSRIPVSITATADDAVGQALIYTIKEQLNHSSVFQYSGNDTQGFNLSIITINNDLSPNNDSNNYSAAVSIVLVCKTKGELDWYMDHWVLVVGRQKTDDMAKWVMAHLSHDVDDLQHFLSSYNQQRPAGQISSN